MGGATDPRAGAGGRTPPTAAPRRRFAASAAAETPSNLPLSLTSFVGRASELTTVREMLARQRLVTLVGPGGIGKSRLALEAAQRSLATFPAGVWRIDLSGLGAADSMDRAIAAALGIREAAGIAGAEALVIALGPRRHLLVLDECELVADSLAGLLAYVLQRCPETHVLATSRQPLHVSGETLYAVPTLGVSREPTGPVELGREDAIALFVERIRAQRPDFQLTERSAPIARAVCRKLDGMPLAIELAAARARHLELDGLLARLEDQPSFLRGGPRDAPTRQRSLQATVDWSVELLRSTARSVFPMLAIFRGGFDAASAGAVAGELEAAAIDDVLAELVDQSLVMTDEGVRGSARYRLLEPIRQHALGMLAAGGMEGDVRRRHGRHFAATARAAANSVGSAKESLWFDRVEADYDNVRSALEWALANDAETALEAAADLSMFWARRGFVSEGRLWLERALETTPDHPQRYRALLGLAGLLAIQGDRESALRYLHEALDASRRVRDLVAETRGQVLLGFLAAPDDRFVRAAFDSAVVAARSTDRPELLCEVLGESASAEWFLGGREAAVATAATALRMAREIGNPRLVAVPGSVLARDATFARRTEAETLWLECVQAARELGDQAEVAFCLQFLALLASWRGDLVSAADSLAEGEEIERRIGHRPSQMQLVEMVGVILVRAGRPFEGLRLVLWKEYAAGPDWIDSPPWWDYVRSEVELALETVGDRAAEARAAARSWSLEIALGETEREIALLREANRKPDLKRGVLTRREAEIAHLTSTGLTNREIGRRLSISERTAEAHIQHILNKLDLVNRAQISAWSVAQDLGQNR